MADWTFDDVSREVDRLAPGYGLDAGAVKSVLLAENTKDGRITSGTRFKGAATNENATMGIGQVIPPTARGLQAAGFLRSDWKHDPNNLGSQLEASMAAMKEMKGRQKNPDDVFELGAMYNGGNWNHKQYLAGSNLSPETSDYLRKMRNAMTDLQMTPQQIEQTARMQPAGGSAARSSSASSNQRTISNSFDADALANFQNESGILQTTLDKTNTFLANNQQHQAQLLAQLSAQIAQFGVDAGASAIAEATTTAGQAAKRDLILQKANLDPASNTSRMDTALSALDQTTAQLQQLRPEIDARMAVGFFDNPLQFIVNQTRLPGMVQQYNNMVGVQQDALGTYKAAVNIAKDGIDISQGADAEDILAAGVSKAAALASKAQVDLTQAQMQAASKTANDALVAVQLQQIGTRNALDNANVTKQKIIESEENSRRADEKKYLEESLVKVNTMLKGMGGQEIDATRWKGMKGENRDALVLATARNSYGENLADSLANIQQFGNMQKFGEQNTGAIAWVNGSRAAAEKLVITAKNQWGTPNGGGKNGKIFPEAEQRAAALNQVAREYNAAAETNMVGADQNNPYKIPYENALKDPKYANNLWAKQLATYGPGGTNQMYADFNEQQFLKRAAVEIGLSPDAPTLTKQYAADISNFYRSASKDTLAKTKYTLMGMPPPTKFYAARLPQFSGTNNKTVDLGDAAQIEKLLTLEVAQAAKLKNLSIFAVGERLEAGRIARSGM